MTADEELQQVQLKTARIDLDLKNLEYRRKKILWIDLLASPPILAVAITACITLGSAAISAITTYNQSNIEAQRAADQREATQRNFENQMRMQEIMGVINSPDECTLARKLKLLLDAGFLKDDPQGALGKVAARSANCTPAPKGGVQ